MNCANYMIATTLVSSKNMLGERSTLIERRELKFRQAIMLQSFEDEFTLPNYDYQSPGEPGQVLTKCDDGDEVEPKVYSSYRSGVGKLLHMMRWSKSEIYN